MEKSKQSEGKWIVKKEISVGDLKRGVNINTKDELSSGRALYSKYCINKVMPKTVDVTTITHIDYGTERVDRSYRSNKDMLVGMINYEGVVDMYIPKEASNRTETIANASLMAAAPEMLDFLKRLDYEMYSNPETREWKTEMYELINKAEGK
jgi:hypothetical protein